MKIRRYAYGQSNVARLAEKRGKMASPQLLAEAAYAPYGMVADVAAETSETLIKFNDLRNASIDADDGVNTERSITEFNAYLKRAKTQVANDPNATADDYDALVQQGIKEFIGRGEMISERNREDYMERAGFLSRMAIEETLLESSIMRLNKSRENLTNSMNLSVADGRFNDARNQAIMGVEQALWDEEAKDKLLLDIDAREIAADLGEQYKVAIIEGKEDAFMEKLGEMDLNDETLAHFAAEKKQIDTFAEQAQARARNERTLEYNDYKASINSTVSPDAVKAWVRERPWLNDYQINALYSAMRQGEKANEFVNSIFADRDSKAARDAMNADLDMTQSVENIASQSVAIAQKEHIVPSNFTNLINNLAEPNENPGDLIDAANYVMAMEEAAPGINLHLNDKAQAKVVMQMDMVKRGVDPIAAASVVTNTYANVNDQTVEARKRYYETEGYGPDNMSPRAYMNEEFTKRLQDTSTETGQMFAQDIDAWWDYDQYGDKDMRIDPIMEDTLNTLAYNFYIAGATEEVSIQSAIRSIRNMGYAATDINYGVKYSGDLEYEFQVQKNPITRVGKEPIPREQVRSMISVDIKGLKLNRVNDLPGVEAREYAIEEIEVGDGIIDTVKGPNEGRMKWPLLSNGSVLTLNGQPLYFWYEDAVYSDVGVEEEEQPVDVPGQTARSMAENFVPGVF